MRRLSSTRWLLPTQTIARRPLLAFSLDGYATFTPLDFVREEYGGVTYECNDRFAGSTCWLCPQFWKYFDHPPDTIYVRLFDSPFTPSDGPG